MPLPHGMYDITALLAPASAILVPSGSEPAPPPGPLASGLRPPRAAAAGDSSSRSGAEAGGMERERDVVAAAEEEGRAGASDEQARRFQVKRPRWPLGRRISLLKGRPRSGDRLRLGVPRVSVQDPVRTRE